ncbi:MAG: 2-C-methyl-D-erythritol 4-phosphate cytidylyltransferase [Clostridia bacterium]|nr:2-C-methyl-D-erythritol 4-phosphate cytidylyltransferase [Clostridia bacterium]
MEVTKTSLVYEKVDTRNTPVPVIIVAAGNSTRMNGTNKQFVKICGVPLIAKTVSAFEKSPIISRIIIVTKKESILEIQKLCKKYNLLKVSDIVEGGSNRTESVKCGINKLIKGENKVLIHDGARPFVSEKMIADVCRSLKTADCALIAKKSTDTVKLTDNESTVKQTLDRNCIYLAQTPQGVDVNKYRFALNSLKCEDYTDDASLMEAMGYKCVVIEGSSSNIKITTPEDIAIAEALLKVLEEKK